MHTQPEIICAAGAADKLLHHWGWVGVGGVHPDLLAIKHLMERVVDTDTLSPGVACKISGNWNGTFSVSSWLLFSTW